MNNSLDRLRLQLPTYSDDRARHRVTDHLAKAHFSIYGLAWPSKAPRRADYFSYFYNLGCVFDHLVSAMLALNRQWRAHEKRILEQLGHLQLAPADVATRMQSLIRHEGENRDMGVGASNIRRLFADVAEISAGEFPGIDVPTDWD